MKNLRVLGLIIGLMLPMAIWAQDATLKVSAKSQVEVGERFQVIFQANADGKKFTAPSFDGFTVVAGPSQSTSSSVQIVNGSMSRSITNSFSYVVSANKEGTFTIGPASYTVDGKVVQSDPFKITVVAATDNSNVAAQGGGQGASQSRPASTNDPQVSGKDLFLKVTPSKRSAYVGEPVVLTYKIYTRLPVSQLSVSKMPAYGGFWMKEVDDNPNGSLRQSTEVVNGIEYTTAEVKKVVVIPQKSGKLTIEPMGIECIAQVQTQRQSSPRGNNPFDIFFDDPFFNRSITNVQKNVETGSLALDVKSLPVDGKPASFTGAVGNYNFSATIDRNEATTNDAVNVTVTVSGSGNLELLNLPSPAFPPDFEVYDPKLTSSVDANSQGMNGTKKAEYLVIPRRAGDFSIPPVEFSFFNPAKGEYVTLRSNAMDVKVNRGTGDESNEGSVFASNQESIKYLGSDIRHISSDASHMRPLNSHFFATATYFIILGVLLALFLVLLAVVRKRREFKQDVVLVRNRQATKVAKGRLKNAYKYLKDQDQSHYYEEMSQALWGYISDKLGIERSVLSMDTVKEAMMDKGIDEALSNQFVDTLNLCEFARFAPGDAGAKMEDLYNKGLDVIMKVEKEV